MIQAGGIALGQRGQVAFVSMASGDPNIRDVEAVKPREDLQNPSGRDWAVWGSDDQLPIQMVNMIEKSGVLESAIDGKARFGLGTGPKPFKVLKVNPDGSEELEALNVPEITEWLEENDFMASAFGWFKDMIGMANFVGRLKFTNDGKKIGLAVRDDITAMRYKRQDKSGNIDTVYIGSDWTQITKTDDPERVRAIPLLPKIQPAAYLTNMTVQDRAGKEFAITGRTPSWNRSYYSIPTWYAAKLWVDIAINVPTMKAAMYQNNIRLKYVVVIYDSYWSRQYGADWATYSSEDKQKKQVETYTSIENWLVGAGNAYKTLFMPGQYDPVTGKAFQDIEVKPIDDTTKQGELLPDSAAANSEILFALMMNPALMGADMPGGPYSGGAGSGSNIREAALVQVMIQEFERHQIGKILNIVKKVNGWPDEVVFRFPGLVLTTLDTGKSTQNVTTGG